MISPSFQHKCNRIQCEKTCTLMANALLCKEAEVQWSEKQRMLVWAGQCSDNQITKLTLSQYT